MTPFLERLRSGDILVADGAMGTMLFALGLETGNSPELWNLEHPGRLTEQPGRTRIQVLDQRRIQGHQAAVRVAVRMQQAVEAVPDADDLPPQLAGRQGRPHDHGVDPGHVAGAHHDPDAPLSTGVSYFSRHRARPLLDFLVSALMVFARFGSRRPSRNGRHGVTQGHAVPVPLLFSTDRGTTARFVR